MPKKKNTKFRAADLAIIFLCFAGSVASAAAFWTEHTRTLTKLNEEAVGKVIFKKRAAQRKFIDRVVWDRLKQASWVYNGDTIRTIELSQAVIIFRDEVTRLSLDANTLIQIFYNDIDGARIDFTTGNMDVVSGPGNVVISSGSSSISVEGKMSLTKSDEGFSLSVTEGHASLDGMKVESGGILAFDSSGRLSDNPVIAMTSFGPSASVSGEGEEVPVYFSWNTSNFTGDTRVIIEVAKDGNFQRIVETRNTRAASITIPLKTGSYWWRAFPADGGSREPLSVMYPHGTLVVVSEETAPEPPSAVTAAEIAQESPPSITAKPQSNAPSIQSPPAVQAQTPLPEDHRRRLMRVSGSGTVSQNFPPNGYSLTTGQLQNAQSINFVWEGKSSEYRFALYRINGEQVIPQSAVTGNFYTLANPRVLTEGEYIWQVYEKDSELPSTATGLIVTGGSAEIKTIQTQEQGEMFGLE